jgi:soluble lytic murein transglycosylase-like protein
MTVNYQLLESIAKVHGLDPKLVAAVVYQESKGDPWAYRFEPLFYTRKIAWREAAQLSGFVPRPSPSIASEKMARSTSWGLMQIMGETARSILRWKGVYLSQLCEPELNLTLGCTYLKRLLSTFNGDEFKALTRYNGSAAYPPKVLKHRENGRWEDVFAV